MTISSAPPLALPTELHIVNEQPVWSNQPDAEDAVRRAVAAAANRTNATGEVCVVLSVDAAVRELNRTWRKIDKPTNVLSFPFKNTGPDVASAMLGDIVIAYETTAAEAAAQNKPFLHHLSHLTVHGFLHLLGYDHENDVQAENMERLEREILLTLGVSDPYLAADIET
jgi:probable rRNA maturation factor